MPDDSGVTNQSPSEMPDLVCDFDNQTGMSLPGSGESISGDMEFSDVDAPMSNDAVLICMCEGIRTLHAWQVCIWRLFR